MATATRARRLQWGLEAKRAQTENLMNFRITKLATIIGVEEGTIRDAARVKGYRLVAGLLCLSYKQVPVEFILECQGIQRMKNAQTQRRRQAQTSHDVPLTPARFSASGFDPKTGIFPVYPMSLKQARP